MESSSVTVLRVREACTQAYSLVVCCMNDPMHTRNQPRTGINGSRHSRPRNSHLHRCGPHLSPAAHRREPEAAAEETPHRQPKREGI